MNIILSEIVSQNQQLTIMPADIKGATFHIHPSGYSDETILFNSITRKIYVV